MKTVYQNKWCKIVSVNTYYVLKSKIGRYNDRYFLTLSEAYKAIGKKAY